ncbi:MAG TPA: hypothetical protein PKO06_05530, partial [Candidatus Ozemobacteraceae bacterium]|nr:hypothetical protein [Candidatus Ozemobacteraceae bacterium]
MDNTVYKIALAGFLHDIGKFAQRAEGAPTSGGLESAVGFFPNPEFINRHRQQYQPEYNGHFTHTHAVYTAAFIDVRKSAKTILDKRLKSDSEFAARFYKALALFLADRMRNTIRHLGYGKLSDEPARDEDALDLDELDIEVLDNVHLAGARFERILKKLMA